MRVIVRGPVMLALLLAAPAWAGALKKSVQLPNGARQEVIVVVPESKAKSYESKGYRRSNAVTRDEAIRYRDAVCRAAAHPHPKSKAPLAQMCADAAQAITEWK